MQRERIKKQKAEDKRKLRLERKANAEAKALEEQAAADLPPDQDENAEADD